MGVSLRHRKTQNKFHYGTKEVRPKGEREGLDLGVGAGGTSSLPCIGSRVAGAGEIVACFLWILDLGKSGTFFFRVI